MCKNNEKECKETKCSECELKRSAEIVCTVVDTFQDIYEKALRKNGKAEYVIVDIISSFLKKCGFDVAQLQADVVKHMNEEIEASRKKDLN